MSAQDRAIDITNCRIISKIGEGVLNNVYQIQEAKKNNFQNYDR